MIIPDDLTWKPGITVHHSLKRGTCTGAGGRCSVKVTEEEAEKESYSREEEN